MDIEVAARLIHSADERVPIEDLELGVSFLRAAAQTIGQGDLRNSTLSR
jgi:acetylornithine deacetylase/succinyl-diaminopimelate desuccinylase-like protein